MLALSAGAIVALLIAIIVLGVLAFEVWMFVDAIKNPHLGETEKILWCIGMLFIHPIVAIVYFFIARSTLNKPRLT